MMKKCLILRLILMIAYLFLTVLSISSLKVHITTEAQQKHLKSLKDQKKK